VDDGVRGRPGPTYRAAANLGVRARVWNLAEICGRGSRPGVAQARETELPSGPGCQWEGEPGKRGPRSAEGGARERAEARGSGRTLAGGPGRVRGERRARWRGPGDAAERACWAGRVRSRGLRRAGPDAGSGVGERAAQGGVWADRGLGPRGKR